MATEIAVSDDIKDLVKEIIRKHNVEENSEIIYGPGSEAGDGYLSKSITVNIIGKNKTLKLFIKYALNVKGTQLMPLEKIYQNESYFYDVIAPACRNFTETRGLKHYLNNIPKSYGTSPKSIIALENLKDRGFQMFDRKALMNESHILAVLKSLAEYHAVVLAFKDQEPKEYQKIVDGMENVFDKMDPNMEAMTRKVFDDFLTKLDAEKDKDIIKRVGNLADRVLEYFHKSLSTKKEYSIITKGDCWSNNMMFLYKDDNKDTPSEIMLVDWQIIKLDSLVLDLSYAFYTLATGKELRRLDYYLKAYHNELSKCLRELGSDPDIVYPYTILERQWKEDCLFGYTMAFSIIKFMLLNKEDAPNLEEIDMENITDTFVSLKTTDEYFDRVKELTEHMIEHNFI